MKKNKKLIALLCAISMILSVFGAFTFVANADSIEKGIVLEYDAKASTSTKAVIKASYVGADSIMGYSIKINLPENYKTVSFESALDKIPVPTEFTDTTTKIYGVVGSSAVAASNTDKLIGTITIDLDGELSSDYTVSLQPESALTLSDVELYYGDETNPLPVAKVTIPTDPSATPAPVPKDRPTGTEEEKPSVKEPVDVEKGIVLVADTDNSTDTKKVVEAYYVGADSIMGYSIKINLPENYKTVSFVSALDKIPVPTEFTDATTKVYGVVGSSAVAASNSDKLIGTITVELNGALSADWIAELQPESALTLSDVELYYGDETNPLPKAWVTVPASESTFKNDQDLSDLLPKADAVIGDDDTDTNSPYYAVVTATKKDGSDAEYGTDYVAYYGDTKLTEGQLTNYLTGKYGPVKDAINNIRFEYNDGVTIAVELDKDGVDTVLDSGATKTSGKATPTPKPTTAPTMSIVTTAGGKVTNKVTEKSILTAIVDVPEKLQVGGAYLLDYLDVDKDGYLELISSKVDEDGLGATFKFQALKAGKVTLTAYYVAEEDDGDDDDTNLVATKTTTLATAKTTVQITKESSSSGSSSSSSSDKSTSSGGGAIALGNQKGTTGNYPGTTSFPDIEGVASWAGPAITRLAAEGIVAGRDDGTFDPDANITRAEYCQMLVQTINKSGVYADVNYDDVPTDAWFYHAVAVASSLGIVEGFGDNTFHPYELITREQMARMTMAATQVQGIYLNSVQSVSFSDDSDIADWSRDSVYTLAEAGVINGMDDGSYFAPRANATRAQAAVIIYKAFFEGK